MHDPAPTPAPPPTGGGASPSSLTVLYDVHCGLCRWIKSWLEAQPSYLTVELIAAGSPEATARYPSLDAQQTQTTLTVVSDDGRVYQGEAGFVMCLYALVAYREWALRLARPFWRPLLQLGLWAVERLRRTTACEGACRAPTPTRGARGATAEPWYLQPGARHRLRRRLQQRQAPEGR